MTKRLAFVIATIILFCGSGSAQWKKTNCPSSGGVYGFAFDGAELYAAVYNSGVYRSTDYGLNWTPVNSGLTTLTVYAVAVAPATDGSGGRCVFAATNGHGIFRSSDRGETWNPANTGLDRWTVPALAVCPDGTGGTTIFAGTVDMGIYRSTDNGDTWSVASTGLPNFDSENIMSLTAVGTDLYACTCGGLFKSTNRGDSWSQIQVIETHNMCRAFAAFGTDLYVGIYTDGVFRSTDNGATWAAANTGLTNTDIRAFAVSGKNLFVGTHAGAFFTNDNGVTWKDASEGLSSTSVWSFLTLPGSGEFGGTNLLAGVSNGGICMMNNSNVSWTAVNNGLTNSKCIALAPSGADLYAGMYGGKVFYSPDNGSSWTEASGGITASSVQCVIVVGTRLFAGTAGDGIYLSTDMGTSWTPVNTGLTLWNITSFAVCPDGLGGETIFAGSMEMGVYRSTDYGGLWTQVNSGLPDYASQNIMSLNAVGTDLYACTFGGVFHSSNGGESWIRFTGIESYEPFWGFAAVGEVLLAGARNDGLFRSTDGGESWSLANDGLTGRSVSDFAVVGNHIFASTFNGGVFLSTNGGTSWTMVNLGLTNREVRVVAANDMYLFAGTVGGGVCRIEIPEAALPISLQSFSVAPLSQSGGVKIEWKTVSEIDNYGFLVERSAAAPPFAFAAVPGSFTPGQGTTQEPHTYAFIDSSVTPGKWTYRLKQMDLDGTVRTFDPVAIELATTAVNDEPAVPAVTSLAQNYPNPFNPTTTLRYTVAGVVAPSGALPGEVEGPEAGRVRLAVYDLLGREVAVLVDEQKQPGEYTATWDAGGMASGIYYYRLTAGGFRETKRMLLVR